MAYLYKNRPLLIAVAKWCGEATGSPRARYDLAEELLELIERHTSWPATIKRLKRIIEELQDKLDRERVSRFDETL